MQVIKVDSKLAEISELRKLNNRYLAGKDVVAVIGFFDGIHKGHQKIISLCVEHARNVGGSSLVFTFDQPPLNVIHGVTHKKLIIPFEEKIKLIDKLGADFIITQNFDSDFSMLSPKEFCKDILLEKFHIREIFVGEGFRFGHKGKGDGSFLREYFRELDINVNIIPLYKEKGITVSSTNIRRFIKEGLPQKAAILLGRQFCISGSVMKGKGRGSELGFPTANISVGSDFITPQDGVYIGKVRIGKHSVYHPCLVNVGDNPTFNEGKRQIEVFIINFNKNIYGDKITVCFLEKIRDEIRFGSSRELVEQAKKDLLLSKNYFNLK